MTVSHFTDNSFVVSNQNFYIRDDDTSSERMSFTPKIGKVNIQSGLVDFFTTNLFAFKRYLSQRDAVLVEGQQWELKRIVGKRHTKRGWEYKVV